MYIPDVGSTNNTLPYPSPGTREGILGKEDFLQLLVTQLENQNPFEPMESYEFAAQLAQFSSLEQLQNLNSYVHSVLISQQSASNALAIGLIGKEVKAVGHTLELSPGSPVDIHYKLPAHRMHGFRDVTVRIYNEEGELVRSIDDGENSPYPWKNGVQNAAEGIATWDGKSDSGKDLPEGAYTYEIIATSPSGESVEGIGSVLGRVSGVKFEGGQIFLSIGNLEVALSDVFEITA